MTKDRQKEIWDKATRKYRAKKDKYANILNKSRIWYKDNKDRERDSRLKRTFGITLIEYNTMFESQNGTCAICHKPEIGKDARTGKFKNLSVDHDHDTGKVRGLLCSLCNHGIGSFKDNEDLLRNAIEYLRNSHVK